MKIKVLFLFIIFLLFKNSDVTAQNKHNVVFENEMFTLSKLDIGFVNDKVPT